MRDVASLTLPPTGIRRFVDPVQYLLPACLQSVFLLLRFSFLKEPFRRCSQRTRMISSRAASSPSPPPSPRLFTHRRYSACTYCTHPLAPFLQELTSACLADLVRRLRELAEEHPDARKAAMIAALVVVLVVILCLVGP
ncbi:hypothetical protein BV20DRAFT_1121647, partial [Pilatotrama ljubarskyi]